MKNKLKDEVSTKRAYDLTCEELKAQAEVKSAIGSNDGL